MSIETTPNDIAEFIYRQYPGAQWGDLVLQPYAYPLTFSPLASSGTASNTITFEANSDFFWCSFQFQVFASPAVALTANTDLVPPITIQMVETSTGNQIFQNPLYLTNLGAVLDRGDALSYVRRFVSNSTVQVTLVNQEATARIVQIALHGIKVLAKG